MVIRDFQLQFLVKQERGAASVKKSPSVALAAGRTLGYAIDPQTSEDAI